MAACLVIVVAGLRGASSILVPFALALFIAVVSLPLLNLMRRNRVPTGFSILFVVGVVAAAISLLIWLVSLASMEVRVALPAYIVRLQELEHAAVSLLLARGVPVAGSPLSELMAMDPERLFGIGLGVLRGATGILSTAFIVTLIFIFILAEAPVFPAKVRALVGRGGADLARSTTIVREIQHYLAIKTLISMVTGITLGVAMWGLGLDFPLLWGLLAFLLNFIPNIGSIIAAIPPILVALLQIGPGMAVLVALVYTGANALFGNFLEPMLVGRQLGISTLVVVLSLIFWGWVWGPIGMFLSVPLTMAVKIGLENTDDFRWIAHLMNAPPREHGGAVAEEVKLSAIS